MGMDSVELIMRVEEDFEIEILDNEAELISTPGALCAIIERKLGVLDAEKRSGCPTSRAFYQVRRELVELGTERQNIRPSSEFDSLLPRAHRRAMWNALSERLPVELPALQRSPHWMGAALLPLVCLPLVWWLGFQATKPRAVFAPPNNRTVADLSRRVAFTFPVVSGELPTRDVWPQLQLIIADELSIAPEKVTRDADLVRDLGLS
jgi:acyl carrier protein